MAKITKKGSGQYSKEYTHQVQKIINSWGNLEAIRRNLGLSGSRICKLLLVDPSAWSRWSKPGSNVPYHVYRTLDLYLQLRKKPLQTLTNTPKQPVEKQHSYEKLEHLILILKKDISQSKKIQKTLVVTCIFLSILTLYLIFNSHYLS